MTIVQYLEKRLATLRQTKRSMVGVITAANYRLDGAIDATEHDLSAARLAEKGQL